MSWVSFDLFRTLGFADTLYLKPNQIFQYQSQIASAPWVLFPEYWQLNALVYGLNARIFPSEASYRLGHNKIEMTRAFELVAPGNTPNTQILPNTAEHADHLWNSFDLPFVAKLPRAAQGSGVWLIESQSDWRAYLSRTDILYVQEYLPIDRDIRVVVVGNQVISAYWRLQAAQGFYNNIARGGQADYSPVPSPATDLALALSGTLGINHAGFDIAVVGSVPYVLEFNRLFGNQGIEGGDARLRSAIFEYLCGNVIPLDPRSPNRRLSARQGRPKRAA